MAKRIFCIVLVAVLLVCAVPISASAATLKYVPSVAATWAKNKDNVDNYNGKCASFVSKCLRVGGLTDIKFTTPGAQMEYIENKGYGTKLAINDTNIKKLKAGDVITIVCSKGHDSSKYWGLHTIFVTYVNHNEGYLKYSAKNNDHCNTKMTFKQLKSYKVSCNKCGSSKNAVAYIISMKAANSYFSKCTAVDTNGTITVTKDTYVKSLPCSNSTNSKSENVVKASVGKTYKTTAMYRNSAGNYWYEVTIDGKNAYVYAGDTTFAVKSGALYISNPVTPSTIKKGNSFAIGGKVIASHIKLTNVTGKITTSSGTTKYSKSITPSSNTYSLKGSSIDSALSFGKLSTGTYHYIISAKANYSWSPDGKTLSTKTLSKTLVDATFKVSSTTSTKSTGTTPCNTKAAVTYSDVTRIVNQYYSAVGGKYWNANVRSDGTERLKTLAYEKTVTSNPCQSDGTKSLHSHAKKTSDGSYRCTSNLFAGVGSVDDNGKFKVVADGQCSGFAAYMEYVIFHTTSTKNFKLCYGTGDHSLKKLAGDTIKPGDQLRYNGHSYVIYKVDSTYAYYIQCNSANADCKITTGRDEIKDIKTQVSKCNGTTSGLFSSPAVKG